MLEKSDVLKILNSCSDREFELLAYVLERVFPEKVENHLAHKVQAQTHSEPLLNRYKEVLKEKPPEYQYLLKQNIYAQLSDLVNLINTGAKT